MYEEKLRDEIIETKKSQTDLVRLKLVVVGVIGATGLGAVPYVPKNAFALFALIPIVCFFLDLVCFHGEIGIASIKRLIRSSTNTGLSESHSGILTFAMFGLSVFLSLILFCIALFNPRKLLPLPVEDAIRIAFGVAGVVGIVISAFSYSYCRNRTCWLEDAPIGYAAPPPIRLFFSSCVKKPNPEPTSEGPPKNEPVT